MADTNPDLTEAIKTLHADFERSQKLRTEAEVVLSVARTRLSETEAKLKELGVEPDNAAAEIETLEAGLSKTVADLQTRIAQEIAACEAIIAAGKQANITQTV
jgi:chromosome segregation ATPase